MRHLTTKHCGATVDDAMLGTLRRVDRAVCTVPACGGINRIGSRQCVRRGRGTTLRPLQVGDVIPGTLASGVSIRSAQVSTETGVESPERTQAEPDSLPDVDLPGDWTMRVRRLPCRTRVHVPVAFRMRHTRAWSQTLEGMAAKLSGWWKLEEGRTKLLLSEVPEGVNVGF